jgi:hypothetical protein
MIIDKNKNNNKKKISLIISFLLIHTYSLSTIKTTNSNKCMKLRGKEDAHIKKSKTKETNTNFYFIFNKFVECFRCTKIRKRRQKCRKYQTHDYYHSEVELNKTHGRFSSSDFAQN